MKTLATKITQALWAVPESERQKILALRNFEELFDALGLVIADQLIQQGLACFCGCDLRQQLYS